MNRPILTFCLRATFAALVPLAYGCGETIGSIGPLHADLPAYAPSGGDAPAATGSRREHPPASREGRPSPFPSVHAHTLKSGLSVVVVEAHALPIVQLRVVVRAGMGYAPKQPGLAELTGEMLKDGGTRSMTSAELLRRIEGLGADLSVDVGADATTVATGVTKSHFGEALALLGEVVQAPRFDDAELAKLKARATDEAEDQLRSSGQFTAMHALFHDLFPDGSPYASYGALPAEIAKVTPAAVRDFHRRFYVPKNVTVVVAGDVTDAEAAGLVERTFGNLADGAPPKVDFPEKPAPAKRRVLIAHRPKSAQSDVFVVGMGPTRNGPGWAEARVCNQILGGGMAGRLFADVREQRSLAYSAYSRVVELAHGAQPVLAYAGTQTEKTADAVLGLLENEERVVASGVTEDETVGARRYLSDVFAIRMETVGSIANMTAELATLGLPFDYWDTYRGAVRVTDATAAGAAARTLYHPDAALIVVAGDADAVAPKLTRFGEVTVVDPEHQFSSIRTLASEQK
jgi:zinc protease